ncbi:group III truncated hemoglobin [Pedobacter sp. UC225_61]|uniref:group III truncated hemoglobin n=1 Tax=Pedobacter sp. UC225_61 TaxID=3374623 RepID=UPI0037AB5EF1
MQSESTDILTLDNVKTLVDDFYGKVRDNALLAPVFNDVIKDNWQSHLEKMYTFWQTILLETPTYSGSPFLKHAKLPIAKEHFDTWISLFNQTVDEHFTGEKASEAKWRAAKMSEMFQYKLDYYKNNPAQPLI